MPAVHHGWYHHVVVFVTDLLDTRVGAQSLQLHRDGGDLSNLTEPVRLVATEQVPRQRAERVERDVDVVRPHGR